MAEVANMPPAVRKYLEQLELALKQLSGVSPEEALGDARDFLMADSAMLTRSGEQLDEDAHWRHIVSEFGQPRQVANQYATQARPPRKRWVYAPGWRICCTKCGRSAPLAAVGGIRIGAKSVHKYTLGYCSDCRWLRWMRIQQDLEQTNLSEQLGMGTTPAQLRAKAHRPLTVIGAILLLVAAILSAFWVMAALFFW